MEESEIVLRAVKLGVDECDVITRILQKRIIDEKGCWNFTGKTNDGGYGLIKYKGKRVTVHKIFFKLLKPDEYKDNLLVCHSCNNRLCFNLYHTYMGTHLDNYKDSVKAGTTVLGVVAKTHCPKGHEYNQESTKTDPKTGNKQCKICYIEYQKQYRLQQQLKSLLNKMK